MSILLATVPLCLKTCIYNEKTWMWVLQTWPGVLASSSVYNLGCRNTRNTNVGYTPMQNSLKHNELAHWDVCLNTKLWFLPLCGGWEVGRKCIFSSRKDKTNLIKSNPWVRRNPSLIKPMPLDFKRFKITLRSKHW